VFFFLFSTIPCFTITPAVKNGALSRRAVVGYRLTIGSEPQRNVGTNTTTVSVSSTQWQARPSAVGHQSVCRFNPQHRSVASESDIYGRRVHSITSRRDYRLGSVGCSIWISLPCPVTRRTFMQTEARDGRRNSVAVAGRRYGLALVAGFFFTTAAATATTRPVYRPARRRILSAGNLTDCINAWRYILMRSWKRDLYRFEKWELRVGLRWMTL